MFQGFVFLNFQNLFSSDEEESEYCGSFKPLRYVTIPEKYKVDKKKKKRNKKNKVKIQNEEKIEEKSSDERWDFNFSIKKNLADIST